MTNNIITTCIKLFNLLPTTPLYQQLIAADYIQEQQNSEITSNAFREGIYTLEIIESEFRNGYDAHVITDVDGNGFGNANGRICAWGEGGGEGIGEGGGEGGHGHGHGDGSGHGNGFGFGNGNGY